MIPPEIEVPIKDFISKRWVIILIIITCIISGLISMILLHNDF